VEAVAGYGEKGECLVPAKGAVSYDTKPGDKFSEWTVIEIGLGKSNVRVCCSCGTQRVVRLRKLITKETKSCGCKRSSYIAANKTKHGQSGVRDDPANATGAYRSWAGMKQRCENRNSSNYRLYGARGIKVCKRWSKFENFYADMGDRPEGHVLDRIDNNGNYTPKNCRWATHRQSALNQRRTLKATLNGVTKTVRDWCAELNLSYPTVLSRIARKYTPEEAIRGGAAMGGLVWVNKKLLNEIEACALLAEHMGAAHVAAAIRARATEYKAPL
jgi:hypothetical protein